MTDSSLSPMEQLLAFCDWERQHNPHPEGRVHVAQWAYNEIVRLNADLAVLDPHRDHWVAIAKAAEAVAASPNCGPAEARALCDALDRLVAAKLGERSAPAAQAELVAQHGAVIVNGALMMCEQFDREPCPHQTERRCAACPGRARPTAAQAEQPAQGLTDERALLAAGIDHVLATSSDGIHAFAPVELLYGIRSALASAPRVPNGWWLAPEELTETMRRQGFGPTYGREGARALWRAMRDVAPQPEGGA